MAGKLFKHCEENNYRLKIKFKKGQTGKNNCELKSAVYSSETNKESAPPLPPWLKNGISTPTPWKKA